LDKSRSDALPSKLRPDEKQPEDGIAVFASVSLWADHRDRILLYNDHGKPSFDLAQNFFHRQIARRAVIVEVSN
jgi:hypothetical protein